MGGRNGWIAAAALVAAALVLATLLREGAEPTAPASSAPSGEMPPPSSGTGGPPEAGTASEGRVIASGGTLVLASAELPAGQPLALSLDLEVRPERFDPHPTRIMTVGREPLDIVAVIDPTDPTRAQIEVPPGWLAPGRYVVDVKTTERSHFPLRRYQILIE